MAEGSVEEFIREFPNQEQVKMMTAWLVDHVPGTFSFTGLVDPSDATVVTPQATVDYGYNWFSLSEGPAVISTPAHARFFSVSVFDMNHNVPDVVVNPTRPIVLVRPGQPVPEGDFTIVELETDQGLVLTRAVVVDNMDEVRSLSESITMDGGDGDMNRPVQRFSPHVAEEAMAAIAAAVPGIDPDHAFGQRSGDVEDISLASAVLIGQLGTPSETVRYEVVLVDTDGESLNGDDTYVVTVPAGIVESQGYFSVTVYATDNKLLIANDLGVYDQTTYGAQAESDGTYTITLSPAGGGKNGIPTGTPFYAILRAYCPVPGADLAVSMTKL